MYDNEYLVSMLAREKQERYLKEAEQDRLAAEFPNPDPAGASRQLLVLVVLGIAGALFLLMAG